MPDIKFSIRERMVPGRTNMKGIPSLPRLGSPGRLEGRSPASP